MMDYTEKDAVYTKVYTQDDLDEMDPGWRERVAEEDRQELGAWLARPVRDRVRIHQRVRSLLHRRFVGGHKGKGETKSCPKCKSKLYFTRRSITVHNQSVWNEETQTFVLDRTVGNPPAPVCMACGHTSWMPEQTGSKPIPEGTPEWVDA